MIIVFVVARIITFVNDTESIGTTSAEGFVMSLDVFLGGCSRDELLLLLRT